MNADTLITVLLGSVGALLTVLWGNLVYEIRKLRKVVHQYSTDITSLNLIVVLLCRKADIQWRPREHESDD